MLKGFRAFISRGNAIDLAVGVIIGAAFAGIVDSLAKDIITPLLGKMGGTPDFSAFKISDIGIGNFINAIISFFIKAAGLYFLIVIPFNRFASKLAAAPATPPAPAPPTVQEQILVEIRDTLKNRLPASSSSTLAETKPTSI